MPVTPDINLGFPKTSDGRPIFTPSVVRGDHNPYYPGAGDNPTTATRGGGQAFRLKASGAPNTHVVNWQFIDSVYVSAGWIRVGGGAEGDDIDMGVYAPGAPVVANPGAGNCNLVPTGAGFNVLIPAAGDGAYDVDLDEALTPALAAKATGLPTKVTKVAPVPAISVVDGVDYPAGYYNWDETTGAVIPAYPDGQGNPTGWWNLYDAEIPLVLWVRNLQLWNLQESTNILSLEFKQETKAKKVLPHWVWRATFTRQGGELDPPLCASWGMNAARVDTV
jgi:hypothetical protein